MPNTIGKEGNQPANLPQVAANQGWEDLETGRFTDVADSELNAFISQLGLRAVTRSLAPDQ